MQKWLTRDGLKAIFTDIAAMPLTIKKGFYDLCGEDRDIAFSNTVFMHTAAVLSGLMAGACAGAAGGGPEGAAAAGITAYWLLPGAVFALWGRENKTIEKTFLPCIAAHAEAAAQNPQPGV